MRLGCSFVCRMPLGAAGLIVLDLRNCWASEASSLGTLRGSSGRRRRSGPPWRFNPRRTTCNSLGRTECHKKASQEAEFVFLRLRLDRRAWINDGGFFVQIVGEKEVGPMLILRTYEAQNSSKLKTLQISCFRSDKQLVSTAKSLHSR